MKAGDSRWRLSPEEKSECAISNLSSTYLTPESEVLHFGFKVPDVCDLWSILSVEEKKQWNSVNFNSIHSDEAINTII